MDYSGMFNDATPHLGGNVREGDPFTYCPSVWDYVVDRFGIKSVLDLGCGLGYSSSYFFKKNIPVLAVDGLQENIDNSIYPAMICDLSKGRVNTRVDLVHCHEVVEHIEEQYVDNLLASMACGKFILMTNATPGQGGHHHVNEQPTEYWIEKLAKYNCVYLKEDSARIKVLADYDRATYMAKTGSIFANKSF